MEAHEGQGPRRRMSASGVAAEATGQTSARDHRSIATDTIEDREITGDAVTRAIDTEDAHHPDTVTDTVSAEAHAVIPKTLRDAKVVASSAIRGDISKLIAQSAVVATEETQQGIATLPSTAENPECTMGADVATVAIPAAITLAAGRPFATDAHRETMVARHPAVTMEALVIAARPAAPRVTTAEAPLTTATTCEASVVKGENT